mmetsp:Transcript_43409/g.80878  ORF Transcript_43409/g.80878 Transcript_43409/m.80878 type:complete len:710 (-) Transcript_43409:132-2261(-)
MADGAELLNSSEEDSEDSNEQSSAGFIQAHVEMFRRNPQLWKVFMLNGLQMGACNLANTFVLSGMKNRYWGEKMSEYQSLASILISFVAVIFGGPFGRFSDAVDRRLAVGLFAFGTFLPGWSLQIFGTTERGLWISTLAQIVGSFGLSAGVSFALATDVTNFQDRELMAGAFFSTQCVLNFVLTAVPTLLILVLGIVPNNPQFMVCAQTILSLAWFLLLLTVTGQKEQEADHDNEMWFSESGEANDPEMDVHESLPPSKRDCKSIGKALKGLVEPFILACSHRRLRRLCLTAFLLAFGGNLVGDIGGQFFQDSLGLIKNPDQSKVVQVAVYSMLPGQIMIIPGNLITGYLAKQSGPLKLLRQLIPIASLLVVSGALMAVVRQMWYIAIVVISLTYANMPPDVVLSRVVAGAAPPGRTGEALATKGTFAMLAGMLGNMGVAAFNPVLLRSDLDNPLWVYYPVCGFLVLLALVPLLGTPRGGWGTASGTVHDQLLAVAYAGDALRRWQDLANPSERGARRQRMRTLSAAADDEMINSFVTETGISEEMVRELYYTFNKVDVDRSGKLTSKELEKVLRASGVDIPESDIQDFVDLADIDNSGGLDFGEFLTILKSKMRGRDRTAELIEAFKLIDKNHDGFVSVEELRTSLQALNISYAENEVTRMFHQANKSGHGNVSYTDFEAFIRRSMAMDGRKSSTGSCFDTHEDAEEP